MSQKPIGKRVKEVRESKGIKANFLAGRIGKTKSWLSKVENGQTALPAEMLKPIATELGVTVGFLFEEIVLETRMLNQ